MKFASSSFVLLVALCLIDSSSANHWGGGGGGGGYRTCADIRCEYGQVCEMTQVYCFRAPCPRIPTCVDRPQLTCANIRCRAGHTCEIRNGRPQCVPDRPPPPPPPLTCANILCQQGYICEMRNGQPQCVPGTPPPVTCATVRCGFGHQCQIINGSPQCVDPPPPPLTCANILCIGGTRCVMRHGRPECVPTGGGGGQCSWGRECRRRTTWGSCSAQRCCRWSGRGCRARRGSRCAGSAPCGGGGGGGGGGSLTCPTPPSDSVGICVERCFPGGCPHGQLCCSNGCGNQCMVGVPSH